MYSQVHLNFIPCSLFPVPYSLLPAPYSLLPESLHRFRNLSDMTK
ncbi:hypothetical protein [Moorena sp. SIO3I8]|nr:hypothetical protein [Moorena sp. SIO3I8]